VKCGGWTTEGRPPAALPFAPLRAVDRGQRLGDPAELVRLGRYPLLVVDEVGYIPFESEAGKLFFQLVSSCYTRASLIATSNKPFGQWGEVFGDDVAATAIIDRLVHHAEVIALKGDSYRFKDRDQGRAPAHTTIETDYQPTSRGQLSTGRVPVNVATLMDLETLAV